ncbi:hypothetical protein ABIQ69_04145 [Agromyces sp. G08B096]|uniref:Uncharacterized protein n=1 Tax=Agromyces sp. G08B096 TaxID=3156399 RepID=A0AAU7WB87_9MICO
MQGEYLAHVDRGKVSTAERLNVGILVVSVVVTALFCWLAVWAAGEGFGWFTVTIAVVGAAAAAASAVLAHRRRRALGLLVAGDGVALAISDAGVRLAGAPLVTWSEVVFVGVADDRARTGRIQRLPLIGPIARTTVRAGSPTLLCELGVRDGEALRAAFRGAKGSERVTLFDEFDGRRRGLVPLMLDAVLDDASAHQAAGILIREAERRGIPARSFDRVFTYISWRGPMLDRKWPVEKGANA